MNLLQEVIKLIQQFATMGGGLWILWGAITLGIGLKDSSGPQIQQGIWQVVGGGMIVLAAQLFVQIKV